MEKILIKKSHITGLFIAKQNEKLGKIRNSQFVPYLDNEIIEEKMDFESSLDWEEFQSVEEFINAYFFDIFENDTVERKIKNMKLRIKEKFDLPGTGSSFLLNRNLPYAYSKTLFIIQTAVRFGFKFEGIQEIQDIRFAAEEYISEIDVLSESKKIEFFKKPEDIYKFINEKKYKLQVIGFLIEVKESFYKIKDNYAYKKEYFYHLLPETIQNYQDELNHIFIFETEAIYKYVNLKVVFENFDSDLLHTEFFERYSL